MLFISKYLPFLPAHGIRKVRLKFVPGFIPRFRSFIISSADEASEFSSRARQASAGEKPAEKRGARRTGSQATRNDPLTRRSRQRRKCPRAEPAPRAAGRGAKPGLRTFRDVRLGTERGVFFSGHLSTFFLRPLVFFQSISKTLITFAPGKKTSWK